MITAFQALNILLSKVIDGSIPSIPRVVLCHTNRLVLQRLWHIGTPALGEGLVVPLNIFFFMARRIRRYRRRSGRRGFRRRRTVARKALTRVRSLSRKIAGEVRKADWNAIIPENAFTQITPAVGTSADLASSLPDFGYLYTVWNTSTSGNVGA